MGKSSQESVGERVAYLYLHSIRMCVNNAMYYYKKFHGRKVRIPVKEIKKEVDEDLGVVVNAAARISPKDIAANKIAKKLGDQCSKFFMMFSCAQPQPVVVYEAAAEVMAILFSLEYRHVKRAKVSDEEIVILKYLEKVGATIERKLQELSIQLDKQDREGKFREID